MSQDGEACQGRTDCAAGLDCKRIGDLKQCTSPPAERCFDELSTPLAYFEVPRASQPVWEFYRLPFPNDIRRSDRGLDLRGHLAFVYPIDTAAVVRDLERSKDGFSTNPVIHFRFSTPIRTSTLTEESLQLVDITPDSPTYKQRVDVEWRFDPTGSLYSCGNWLAVSPRPGDVLRPRTTYAALLTRQVRARNGNAVARSTDFQAMLRDEAPPEVAEAHATYAPLRAFARDTETDLDLLLNATVFTTHDPEHLVIGLREAVARDGVPALHDVTLCSQGTRSPCEDAGRGACSDVDPEYWEVHGRISLPVYQHGAPPYTAAADGGGLQLDASGVPVLARRENVCFAITVPKHGGGGPLPVVLFGHGTGGSFRGVVTGGLARDLATGVVDGRPLRTASVGFDLPQHGSRRGGSTMEPEHLFFNVANPIAARGNVLQGTADFFAWLSFLTKGDTRPISDAIGIQVGFDIQHIAIFTHSQGSTHASIALPYAPEVLAAVLSGNGGHLVTSLLTKTQPVDVAGLIAVGLLDPVGGIDPSNVAAIRNAGVAGGRFNPMLSLIQGYFDASDPLNFAYRLQGDPWSGAPAGHHVFMTYGLDDHFSTEPTLQAYARAAQFVHVTPALVAFGLAESAPPLRGNAVLAGVPRTLGLRQYRPDPGDDGHHVATRTVEGRADALRFLLESLAGGTPSIGAEGE